MIITTDILKHSIFVLFEFFFLYFQFYMRVKWPTITLFRVQICVEKEDSICERTRASERKRQFVFQQMNKAIENEDKKIEF